MNQRVGVLLAWMVGACGGDGPQGQSVCDNVVPPPAACMTTCDPAPGAPNTCPGGYHCAPDGQCDAVCTASGGECGSGYRCTSDGRCVGEDSCVGLECRIDDCEAMGMSATTITGTVFAPNGTLPLYGINVYIPNQPLPPVSDQIVCDRCGDVLPGAPVTQVITDEAGKFTLTGVPSGTNIPLVISTGKWRREITLPSVTACGATALPATDTRLPKNKAEGSIPKIAITTGSADSLECLVRRLGVDDSEITTSAGTGRINLFNGNGVDALKGGFAGGSGPLPSATPFWADTANLDNYDIVILSCEGDQNPGTKPQGALDAMKAYADLGGRVFASHWHNVWIGGAFQSGGPQTPAVWDSIATWDNQDNPGNPPVIATIDEVSNPKGVSFATWMLNVMGSTTRGQLPITEARVTSVGLDATKAERWVYLTPQESGSVEGIQNFQFTTPNEVAPGARCGKVVFSDMHVSGGPDTGDYPDSCGGSMTLSPQEKALAFMFFDIASCVSDPIL